jgi:hypothetical protein
MTSISPTTTLAREANQLSGMFGMDQGEDQKGW